MESFNVKITSKNQITIPAKVVRMLGIQKNRVLKLVVEDDESISLTPEKKVGTVMSKHWGNHKAGKGISEANLKRAIRESAARKSAK